jgi:hypothetical protein
MEKGKADHKLLLRFYGEGTLMWWDSGCEAQPLLRYTPANRQAYATQVSVGEVLLLEVVLVAVTLVADMVVVLMLLLLMMFACFNTQLLAAVLSHFLSL